ncbi:MAG: exo-alpha-sialidase, partial [Pirellulales bacterium]|nr:exo-alpha-sialidase [Pirellulales bacterium]
MTGAAELLIYGSRATARGSIAAMIMVCWCSLTISSFAGDETATSRAGFIETATVWPNYTGDEPSFRIPALIVSPGGDLLAFAERRNKRRWGDWGDFDVVMKRSTDNGRTWSPTRVLYDYGTEPCLDITPVVDRVTDEILLLFLRGKVEYCLMRSSDDGHTWSEPRSIHADVVRPEWDAIGVGREARQRYGV